jgi:hypothetical protein
MRIQDLAAIIPIMIDVLLDNADEEDYYPEERFARLLCRLESGLGPLKNVEPIPMDEPVFLLRAKDIVAPSVVRTWATAAHSAGASDDITAAARRQADEMERWQEKHGFQVPDMPPQGPCGHCGNITHLRGPDGDFWCSPECMGG